MQGQSRPSRKACAVVLALLAYVALHFGLSRLSMHQIRQAWGFDCFIYIPLRPETIFQDERWLLPHHLLRVVFWPVAEADQWLFHGPVPIDSMPLVSLGGERRQPDAK